MPTSKQIEANRRNSQLSTGPRSDAGKSITRMNALKSGLHAESHVIRSEDPEALAQLSAEYYAEFQPTTPRQRDLLDTVIHNQWLIRRLRLTESDLHARHFEDRDHDFDPKWDHHVAQHEHPLSDAYACLEKRLLRLQSRVNSLERSTRLALKELRDLQSGVGVPACQPAEGRQPLDESAPSPAIGFVPSIPCDPESPIPNTQPQKPAQPPPAPHWVGAARTPPTPNHPAPPPPAPHWLRSVTSPRSPYPDPEPRSRPLAFHTKRSDYRF